MELLIVLFIVGILAGLGLPRMAAAKARANVEAAKTQIVSQLATARATSIRRGLPSRFNAQNGAAWVSVQNGVTDPAFSDVGPRAEIETTLGVTVIPSTNAKQIQFDARGFANLVGGAGKIYVSNGAKSDSICITKLGAVLKGGCL